MGSQQHTMRSLLYIAALACAFGLLTTEATIPDPDPEMGLAEIVRQSGALDVNALAASVVLMLKKTAHDHPRVFHVAMPSVAGLFSVYGFYDFMLSDFFANTEDTKSRAKEEQGHSLVARVLHERDKQAGRHG